ncbi:MAG: EF-hand domain-containing protein, partial [Methylococcaceae bacterium]
QQPKASGGAGDSEAKKTNKEEQTTSPGGKAETAAPTAGTPSEQVKQTHPAEQKAGEANGAATANKSEEKTSSGESKAGSAESATTEQKISPVKKSEKDSGEFPSGKLPSFAQVDVNGDHYITKDELQNFPELLQVFDKIDAGKDGKLEQHEYQNLEMETIREGEVL